ncbi:MAG TPA: PPK2 family polyphosphate kinase [Chloroflexota bacterium]
MPYAHLVTPGEKVHLADFDPGDTHDISRDDATASSAHLEDQLTALQEALYASGDRSIVIVLQGIDTAGKDGTIKHVMAAFNPAGCRVESFKVPTPVELAHDFLWRVHRVTPANGAISIFNRSHYEDVLVARVHKLVPQKVWERRYAHINDFESLLADNGTIILKFFLYISKQEQKERLEARQQDPMKAWKLSPSDWSEHELYDAYIEAYQDALERCSTRHAPWYIVPADHKWFRNLAVAQTLVDVLEPDVNRWEEDVRRRGRENLEAIRALPRRGSV